MVSANPQDGPGRPRRLRKMIYRHSVLVRVTHWIVVLCVIVLLMSGLQIFNAHPALYWGDRSDFDHPLFSMTAAREDGRVVGVTAVFGHRFETTGWLGLSPSAFGEPMPRGFPTWITLPSYQDLATGRRWHFFFAWLLVITGSIYLLYTLLSGHAWRDLVPSRAQLRHIGRSILDHLRLRFPKGHEAEHYNVLQRLSYLTVVFILVPVLVLAGLALSPAMDVAIPQLLTVFGGRQSARTIHFVAAFLLVAFVVVHVLMVLLSGVFNNLRSMMTGRYAVEYDEKSDAA